MIRLERKKDKDKVKIVGENRGPQDIRWVKWNPAERTDPVMMANILVISRDNLIFINGPSKSQLRPLSLNIVKEYKIYKILKMFLISKDTTHFSLFYLYLFHNFKLWITLNTVLPKKKKHVIVYIYVYRTRFSVSRDQALILGTEIECYSDHNMVKLQ